MNFFSASIIGFFMGFGFGVGCALAVMYSLYSGGYRKAMEDSLREEKSERYLRLLPKVQSKLARELTHPKAAMACEKGEPRRTLFGNHPLPFCANINLLSMRTVG